MHSKMHFSARQTLVNTTACNIRKINFGICPEFEKVSPMNLSSAEINRHYPVIAEFQIGARIIKS